MSSPTPDTTLRRHGVSSRRDLAYPAEMAKDTPKARPALARAADSGIHPVSGQAAPVRPMSYRPTKGTSTSDAIRGPAKDKLVDLGVRIPRSLRKQLRGEAKARHVTVDDLVAAIVAAALPPK